MSYPELDTERMQLLASIHADLGAGGAGAAGPNPPPIPPRRESRRLGVHPCCVFRPFFRLS